MVNEKVLIRDKWRFIKKVFIISIIVFLIILVLVIIFFTGAFMQKSEKIEFVLENPLKNIVFANTVEGRVDKNAVVEEGIKEFNEQYINYILAALGVGNLHKSIIYGNPLIEFSLDEEVWNSELEADRLKTGRGAIDKEDLRILVSKKEAVEALLSSNIREFMKNSVANGNTKIEMVAGKLELASKGYLAMYKELTGEEIEVEKGEVIDTNSSEFVYCESDEDCVYRCSYERCFNNNVNIKDGGPCGVFCCKCINNVCVSRNNEECGF